MDTERFPVTQDEYGTFHAMDRALYSLLALKLWRDPYESVQVLALWLWIERQGFKKFILMILSMPPMLINNYADEALRCVKCIKNPRFVFSAEASGMPLTSKLVKGEISLLYFHENRATVLNEIREIVSEVCAMALQDLIEDAIKKHAAYASLSNGLSNLGFVGETSAGSCDAGTLAEDRTMFITFSRGYPVSESEVRGFFTKLFGKCIEAFHMQTVNPDEQALYARVVFSNSSIIESILDGVTKAKYTINGKHVWMRRYVPKRGSSVPRLLLRV